MRNNTSSRGNGFTLVEMLVSTAIIGLIMIVLVQVTGQTSAVWRYTTGRAEQFRESRRAFDSMTRRLSQATLNTYLDYDSYGLPKEFVRRSELRFICGPVQNGPGNQMLDATKTVPRPGHGIFFQAPFGFVEGGGSEGSVSTNYKGLDTLLNTWGYFVEVDTDARFRPPFITDAISPPRIRYRLMEYSQPSEKMNIYGFTSGRGQVPGAGTLDPDDKSPTAPKNYGAHASANRGFDWFRGAFAITARNDPAHVPTHVLAENVIALVILPQLSREDAAANFPEARRESVLAPEYYYHSGETGAAEAESNKQLKGFLNSRHQLPPVLQITMVAIDEASAVRSEIQNPLEDKYGVLASDFLIDSTKYKNDILYDPNNPKAGVESVEKRLINKGVNYRIFTSNVYLRGSKWSSSQTN